MKKKKVSLKDIADALKRKMLAHDAVEIRGPLGGVAWTPPGREPQAESSIAAQRERNAHLAGKDEAAYVALRTARDATLPVPQLLLPALQVNIRAGRLPEPDADGHRYLRIPLDRL